MTLTEENDPLLLRIGDKQKDVNFCFQYLVSSPFTAITAYQRLTVTLDPFQR